MPSFIYPIGVRPPERGDLLDVGPYQSSWQDAAAPGKATGVTVV